VRIGANSVLSQDCWLNVNHRKDDALAIEIGDHCFIGRRNFFSSGRRIDIGHYVLTANDCHFLGSSHVVSDPLQPCITTGTTDFDTISVGHNTFFGAGVRVLGSVSIGHGCVVGAGSLVTRDVPPFSQVAGFPAAVFRRYSFLRKAWVPVSDFRANDERALLSADEYLEQLRQKPFPRMPYLAAGSDMGQY
jgi:acetyltransferase-like isoleucine patch superfamily enzyme